MNFKILLLVIIAGVGVSSYGVLANDMSLDIQKFDIIILPPMEGSAEGETQFSGVQCSCRDPDNLDSGAFSPDFCDVTWITDPAGPDGIKGNEDDVPGVPTPTSLGLNGNMLCTWEASSTVYGGLLDYDEGCSANYWLKSSDPTSLDYSWPMGYHPDYLYEDIFHIGFNVIDDTKGKKSVSIDEDEIQKFTEAYEMYVTNLEKLLENKRIDTKTAMALKWLLNAIPPPDEEGYSKIASNKLDSFNHRLDMFVERSKLTQEDKDFIHGLEDELDEINVIHQNNKVEQKITLLDALTNNVLSPSDKQIAKQSVAALLNSAHFQVTYHYSVSEIMLMTQSGIINDDQIKTANEFKKHNLAGGSPLCSSDDD